MRPNVRADTLARASLQGFISARANTPHRTGWTPQGEMLHCADVDHKPIACLAQQDTY